MRTAEITRNTNETRIRVAINLDGTGKQTIDTGVPFLDHMLDQIARHGLIDLDIKAEGDLHIDAHHTVEDVGITLGMAIARAAGTKAGLRRYGHATCRWTRRCRAWWWISRAVPASNTTSRSPAPASATSTWT